MRRCFGLFLLFVLGLMAGLSAQDYPGWTLDEITVQGSENWETSPSVAYNMERDEFLVIWQDDQNGNWDVYGCFISSDGAQVGAAFPICTDSSNQYAPHLDYNRIDEQYLVVWMDLRFGMGDILGVLLDGYGHKLAPVTQKMQSDTSFVISDADTTQGHPRVAHNFIENTYLVVWVDYRVTYPDIELYTEDIYAQRLDSNGGLLPPNDAPDTQVNYPIVKMDYEEYSPDVTYVPGIGDFTVNEWLVIWVQDGLSSSVFYSNIYARRIDGKTGMWLNSFGEEVDLPEYSASRTAASLGAYSELKISNSVNMDLRSYCGSPHVKSFMRSNYMPKSMDETEPYPVPEVMVVWTDFRNSDVGMMNNPDIYCQRLAYFPDSTARRLGLKWLPIADTTNATVIPLDENGDWAAPPIQWLAWDNIEVCRRADPQSYNGIGLGLNDAEYLIAWNDWRSTGYYSDISDIYGQRIAINPLDSALVFLDENGNVLPDKQTNIPIAVDPLADEGNHMYPAVGHGSYLNKYLIAYNYYVPEPVGAHSGQAQSAGPPLTDIHATVVNSRLPDNSVRPLPGDQLPAGFVVAQNYPNPFNPVTRIQFGLPHSENVTVKVFDVLGREMAMLLNQKLEAGDYEVIWDGKDLSGSDAASGVYFLRIEAGDHMLGKKMVLMR